MLLLFLYCQMDWLFIGFKLWVLSRTLFSIPNLERSVSHFFLICMVSIGHLVFVKVEETSDNHPLGGQLFKVTWENVTWSPHRPVHMLSPRLKQECLKTSYRCVQNQKAGSMGLPRKETLSLVKDTRMTQKFCPRELPIWHIILQVFLLSLGNP